LIVRHEPLHPGAQRSLFPSFEFRYWGFYTDQPGDPRDLDTTMRAHAHVEQHIARLNDSGLCRFPSTSFDANAAWMMTVALAADLLRWFQLLCLPETWAGARPKTLRWAILHAPGRLVHRARRRIVRIIDDWPTANVILGACQRIDLIWRTRLRPTTTGAHRTRRVPTRTQRRHRARQRTPPDSTSRANHSIARRSTRPSTTSPKPEHINQPREESGLTALPFS
jgi:hypothetical protein